MVYKLTHLKELEAESIYVLREVAAQFEKPAILFSGGKDSIVVTYLAYKAFFPAKIPFPLVHIDTGHNFQETLDYRDNLVKKLGAQLIVGSVQESIDTGRVKEEKGYNASRNRLQTTTLLDTIEKYKFDACIGGARRDEEKARAKERFFSHRDEFGQWNPKNQRPELWNIFNGKKNMGEHFRVFPISNWTEMDVWQYIYQEKIELQKTSVQIKDIVNELNDDYKIELENNNIDFIVKTKIPNAYISVDILKLKRIFSNMISNSARYLTDGGKIEIDIYNDNNDYKFVISDNGPGVDEKIINKIFDPLFTTDYSRKISGLGLSICKEFIEMHGGKIEAYNNNGLTIEFTIPKSERNVKK